MKSIKCHNTEPLYIYNQNNPDLYMFFGIDRDLNQDGTKDGKIDIGGFKTGSGFMDLILQPLNPGTYTGGKVGIGTWFPTVTLDVNGEIKISKNLTVGGDVKISSLPINKMVITDANGNLSTQNMTASSQWTTIGGNIFYSVGAVSIGTSIFEEFVKLNVCGIIKAKEVIVDAAMWCDFVFDNNYKLMPLHELKKYIEINKRLPDIPSAENVKEKGVGLGEMQRKLLQKTEEMALYIINQDERIEKMEKEIDLLKEQLTILKK